MPEEVMSGADSCNVGPDNDDIMNCHIVIVDWE